MIDGPTLGVLALLGAVVGLDFVSFPQAMLSRPIVAATLGGAVCGNASAGLLVGLMLECFALETMPFGASRYPEWGPASVATGVVVAVPGADPESTARLLPFAIIAGLGCALVAGRTLIWLRRFNLSLALRRRAQLDAGEASTILGLQRIGMAADFVRAGVVTTIFVLLLVPVRNAVLSATSVSGAQAVAVAETLAVGVAGGAIWKAVHVAKGYAWWLLAGVVAGAIVVVAR